MLNNKYKALAEPSDSSSRASLSAIPSTNSMDERTPFCKRYRKLLLQMAGFMVLTIVAVGATAYFIVHFLTKPEVVPTPAPVPPTPAPDITGGDPCDVFCRGPILMGVQRARLFSDSKSFVDHILLKDPNHVLHAWETKKPTTREEILSFVNEFFEPQGHDTELWTPTDWEESPEFLNQLSNDTVRGFAQDIHKLWKVLGRQLTAEAKANPIRTSFIQLKNPEMMVPGGRFREFYYWDSYWMMKGLLVSGMDATARKILENMVGMVETLGFVPNGARRYYTMRSQPPVLALMMSDYIHKFKDVQFLRNSLHQLVNEHKFWIDPCELQSESHCVLIRGRDGELHSLSRFYTNWTSPRPESFIEDEMTASKVPADQRAMLHANIAAAAETGWDFSSRWMGNGVNLSTAQTMNIIPVDLNAILYKVEIALRDLHLVAGENQTADYFDYLASRRANAIYQVLWDNSTNQWRDYNFIKGELSSEDVASNFIPLWAGCLIPDLYRVTGSEVADALISSGLIQPGGITTTLQHNGQQWDWPNAWAPIQHMIIEGLADQDGVVPQDLGVKLAETWLATNYICFKRTKAMLEKYDARILGGGGEGGEYDLQIGFGWTNGVILSLLDRWPKLRLIV